jgi:hypothetical protein
LNSPNGIGKTTIIACLSYPCMLPPYLDADFPWTFYFNGVALPKWGWGWNWVIPWGFADLQRGWDQDVGLRDIYIWLCTLLL